MYAKDCEPTVEEMLADPIVQLLMKGDDIAADDVRQVIRKAREAVRYGYPLRAAS